MSRVFQAFRRSGWKGLALGVLTLVLYGSAVFFFCNFQEEPSVSVFLSSVYPDGEQAEEILEAGKRAGAETDVCFYWDGGMDSITEPEYGRSVQVLIGGLYGNAALYDWRLNSFWEGDRGGCVIDERSAWELFGTKQAEGRYLKLRGKQYQVRQVLPWNQNICLIRPEKTEAVCTRVFLKNEKTGAEKTAEQFLMGNGLSGTVVDGGSLHGAAMLLLALLPAAVFFYLLKWACREKKAYSEKEGGYWLWVGTSALLIGTAAAVLWNKVEIPGDWIPSRWSDFQFWSDRFRSLGETLRLFIMLPKTVLQAENIFTFIQCAVCSVSALAAGILFLFISKRNSLDK